MNVINSILKSVPKTADGFDDIEGFWKATDKLTFPLENRIRGSLFKAASPPPKSPASAVNEDSDLDFNYDTSASISGKYCGPSDTGVMFNGFTLPTCCR